MNTENKEAINKWWEIFSFNTQKVIAERNGYTRTQLVRSQEKLQKVYLKEHESKEETLDDAKLRMSYQSADMQDFENKTGSYEEVSNVSEINNCDGCRAGMPLRDGIYHINAQGNTHMICSKTRYQQPKEEPVSEINYNPQLGDNPFKQKIPNQSTVSISVEEAAKNYSKRTWGIHLNDLSPHSDNTLGELTELDFTEGANWRKEQDKIMVEDMLDVIRMFHATMTAKDYTERAFTAVQSAITKAETYLNK